MRINTSPNTLNVYTAEYLKKRSFSSFANIGVITQGQDLEIQNALFSKRKTIREWKLVKRFISRSSSIWLRLKI